MSPKKIELEAAIEARCCAKVEAAGGLALKLLIPSVRGFPDRSCLLPGRRVFFIEVKRIKSGRVSAQQNLWWSKLAALGFGYYLVDTDADFDRALERELAR